MYEAIGHQQWKDSGKPDWDCRANEPIQSGDEPIPKIEEGIKAVKEFTGDNAIDELNLPENWLNYPFPV